MNVWELLESSRICICGGSGGVGKTTTAAAIALGMAARGKRVAVVTIDPAKRLASALGLDELGNEPALVDPSRFKARGDAPKGELWAMMLDPKRTFDELIEVLAKDERSRDEVLSNRVYQQLSSAIGGSQEFTAVAKLFDLDRDGGFDLIVLDTPPSRNALDFLDAPGRLTSFFEGRALAIFMRPTGVAARVVGKGTGVVFKALERVTGVDLLADLSTFFLALGGMIDGFKERAARVETLLADPGTIFLLVTSPARDSIDEAIYFRGKLEDADMHFGGAVVNRVRRDTAGIEGIGDARDELEAALGADLATRVLESFEAHHALAERDARNIARLSKRLGDDPLLLVPELDDEIHDIAGLASVEAHLFAI